MFIGVKRSQGRMSDLSRESDAKKRIERIPPGRLSFRLRTSRGFSLLPGAGEHHHIDSAVFLSPLLGVVIGDGTIFAISYRRQFVRRKRMGVYQIADDIRGAGGGKLPV